MSSKLFPRSKQLLKYLDGINKFTVQTRNFSSVKNLEAGIRILMAISYWTQKCL